MIDPNNPVNLNPQDLSGQQNSQVDPSFLPKDSNVYIRTMNTDLSNLKNQGGEALPYVETPTSIPNIPSPVGPAPVAMPAIDISVQAPVESKPEVVVNNPIPSMGIPTPVNEQPSTLDNLTQKLNELNPNASMPSMPQPSPTSFPVNNLSSNLNTDLNNLITPEEFSPMANVDPNEGTPKGKSKLMILIAILGLGILLVIGIIVMRSRAATPKINVKTNNPNTLVPPTTIAMAPVTKPSPFMPLKNAFQLSDINIDISKSPEIVNQVKDEAKILLAPNEFKVIAPKIKNTYLTATEVVNAFVDNAPQSLMDNLLEKYLVYSFYGEVHPALGIILQVKSENVEAIKTDFLT